MLLEQFTKGEVITGLKGMGPTKAQSQDIFSVMFFKSSSTSWGKKLAIYVWAF